LQRRWQDGCRIWPLLARGFGYTLYVVPGAVCTTARWTCQGLIHVRDKLLSAYQPHVSKKQALASPEASTWIIRRWAGGPPGRYPAGSGFAPACRRPGGPGPSAGDGRWAPRRPATPAGSAQPAAGGSATVAGCHHPARARALFPCGLAPDRDHGRADVRALDRRIHRPARFAPGMTPGKFARPRQRIFSGPARKPIP